MVLALNVPFQRVFALMKCFNDFIWIKHLLKCVLYYSMVLFLFLFLFLSPRFSMGEGDGFLNKYCLLKWQYTYILSFKLSEC